MNERIYKKLDSETIDKVLKIFNEQDRFKRIPQNNKIIVDGVTYCFITYTNNDFHYEPNLRINSKVNMLKLMCDYGTGEQKFAYGCYFKQSIATMPDETGQIRTFYGHMKRFGSYCESIFRIRESMKEGRSYANTARCNL